MAQDLDDDFFDDPGFSNGEELYSPPAHFNEEEWVEFRLKNLSDEANLSLSDYVLKKGKPKPKRPYFAAAILFAIFGALIFIYLIYSIYLI